MVFKFVLDRPVRYRLIRNRVIQQALADGSVPSPFPEYHSMTFRMLAI
jgi:hypothetical protein